MRWMENLSIFFPIIKSAIILTFKIVMSKSHSGSSDKQTTILVFLYDGSHQLESLRLNRFCAKLFTLTFISLIYLATSCVIIYHYHYYIYAASLRLIGFWTWNWMECGAYHMRAHERDREKLQSYLLSVSQHP